MTKKKSKDIELDAIAIYLDGKLDNIYRREGAAYDKGEKIVPICVCTPDEKARIVPAQLLEWVEDVRRGLKTGKRHGPPDMSGIYYGLCEEWFEELEQIWPEKKD